MSKTVQQQQQQQQQQQGVPTMTSSSSTSSASSITDNNSDMTYPGVEMLSGGKDGRRLHLESGECGLKNFNECHFVGYYRNHVTNY